METDLQRRRVLLAGLAVLFLAGIVGFGFTVGFPMAVTGYFRDLVAESEQSPINNPEIMYASALDYQHQGNEAMATAAARRAVIISPAYAPAHRFLAAQDLKNKDFTGAAKECQGIIQGDPNDGAARLGLASAYEGMGESDKAQEIYHNVVSDAAFNTEVRRAAQQHLGSTNQAAKSAPNP